MARWKINAKHYLMAEQYGEPTEWVREETNRETGRTFRKTYKVPLYIDPEDRLCCNREGVCVIATKETAHAGDIVWAGDPIPTPDMEPLDDEARRIHDKWSPNWVSPIDSLPSNGEEFSLQIIRSLENKINEIGKVVQTPSTNSELDELKKMIAAQQAQIAQLMAGPRPSVEPPLENIDPDAPRAPPPLRAERRV